MKRNALTLVVGIILLLIFFLLLFTFQVRQTEVVVLTTFAKPSAAPIDQPGLYFKWPIPIQRVYRFDKRVHSFEDEFEQMLTRDGNNILASVYVGWTIQKPREFFNSFAAGSPAAAEPQLKSFVRSTKQAVIGQHAFSDFVSSDPKQVKFVQIEQEILNNIRQGALDKYGVNVQFVGIKRLGLPEPITQKVFDRMTAERQREIDRLKAEGEKEAIGIRSAADRDRSQILAKARADATRIRGEAEGEAMKSFDVFKQNEELAIFLMNLQALERALNKGATLVVDPRTAPFNLLSPDANGRRLNPTNSPATAPRREQELSATGAAATK
ncbi:MAG TPA: protease modulator HflC [Verrucomicrobiae bacterium]|nr:protease modulator HflC [Verrucomicrobiae bacterium]